MGLDSAGHYYFIQCCMGIGILTLIKLLYKSGADLGGGCRGCEPSPEITCGFLIQLVFSKKKKKTMWFIGVEVEQETSAPPPKQNPGSTPVNITRIIFSLVIVSGLSTFWSLVNLLTAVQIHWNEGRSLALSAQHSVRTRKPENSTILIHQCVFSPKTRGS